MTDLIGDDPGERRSSGAWGWWVALGILLVIAAVMALGNLFVATVASVAVVGALMIIGGVAQIVFAFPVRRRWGRFILWLLLGVLYLVAGVVTLRNPALATLVLTLALAASLIAVGILRIAAGFALKPHRGWGWVIASGLMTLILGIVIGVGWPTNSVWVLGIFLGVDLLCSGAAYILFGIALRAPAGL